jgi:arginase
LAVKIVRQPKKIALIGACSSAAAFLAGTEKAPAALRAAGLVEKLKNAGFEVNDLGDCPPRLFADDDEHRRARNLPAIVAGLNDLKLHAEVAIKSGALVLVLGGDCAQVIGLLAGARRYYKHINLMWMDRDADLNTPASTPSGRIDGMVVAHIIGRGAPELVRFYSESPLVREPDVQLYGLERVDPPEAEFLAKSPMRHVDAADIQRQGPAAAAKNALAHLHADSREFVLHLDTDIIAQEQFAAVNVPGSGGLSFEEVRLSLREMLGQQTLLGLDVAQYNPERDADGSCAQELVALLVDALSARLNTTSAEPAAAAPAQPVAPEQPPEHSVATDRAGSETCPAETCASDLAEPAAAPAEPEESEPSSEPSSPEPPSSETSAPEPSES